MGTAALKTTLSLRRMWTMYKRTVLVHGDALFRMSIQEAVDPADDRSR